MLAVDGSPRAKLKDGSQRATSTLWIGGCVNPPGDGYAGCGPFLQEVVRRLGNDNLASHSIPAEAPDGLLGWGKDFTAHIPTDIISSRELAKGVVFPYGVELVFFAHCGGTLRRIDVGSSRFPLGCFDADTGEQLGRDDFEFGFYTIYAYESLRNENPEITTISFDGESAGANCSDTEPCDSGHHCGSELRCIPVVAHCTKSDKDDCRSYALAVDVPRSSREVATTAHVRTADANTETLWVSYYSSAGSFEEDARIVSDPKSGWGTDTFGKWRAKTDARGEVRLYAVVHDDRNGLAWRWQDVWVK
jgi:hypothetical protein